MPAVTRGPFQGSRAWILVVLLGLLVALFVHAPVRDALQTWRARRAFQREHRPLVEWARRERIPLVSLAPDGPDEDLRAFDREFARARVVAVGEVTHGTSEVQRFRHRLFRYLVREHDFRVVAVEDGMVELEAINAWVQGADGDPRQHLQQVGFWLWKTEETLALVEWMRSHDLEHGGPLEIHGVDRQQVQSPARALLSYLEVRDEDAARTFRRRFAPLLRDAPESGGHGASRGGLPAWTRAEHVDVAEACSLLAEYLDANEAPWSARGGAASWRRARRLAQALGQGLARWEVDVRPGDDPDAVRDRSMADNILHLLESRGKVLIAAHDAHVQARGPDGVPAIGDHLRAALGDELLIIGTGFDRGEFLARHAIDKRLMVHRVPSAPPFTLDSVLARVDSRAFWLDLRQPPAGSVSALLSRPVSVVSIGALFHPPTAERYVARRWVRQAYDVLVFFPETTAVRPLEERVSGTVSSRNGF